MKKFVLPVVVLIAVVGGLGAWYLLATGSSAVTFKTEKVTRGELLASVSATGTVEPEDVVDVGAQVAGSIKEFGIGDDGRSIDYGSPVEPGMVLARIDDSLYKAKVEQSRALLRSAERRYEQAKSKVEQAKAKVEQAKANTLRANADQKQAVAKANQSAREWDRVRQLGKTGAVSQSDYDIARANDETNQAGLAVAEAAIAQAKAAELDAISAVADAEAAVGDMEAAIATAKAVLQQDDINLGYCTIKSPVRGTIIDRRVTLGQTVQAAFNTPSLFLIAKDLSRMTVWASVNEADISQIRIGQTARFTVDAHPNRSFTGAVTRVRLNATNTQNVVVYTVEVTTDNSEGQLLSKSPTKPQPTPDSAPADKKGPPADKSKSRPGPRGVSVAGTLLPYMTANLQFEVDRRTDALLVPNAALRYKPSPQAIASGGGSRGKDAGAPERDKPGQGVVWVEENGKAKAVPVKLGLTDGNATEVLGGELEPGTAVIVGEVRSGVAPSEAGNPFAAPKFGGKKQ
ncbi:MAG TPA: HlyD family efflux transporter periplasmic adaptor subunit [Gemmataceae bacterium]|nr:HlyD family efflux transporter periplasmic adaptor subunit [Gemmataceae bacterium]